MAPIRKACHGNKLGTWIMWLNERVFFLGTWSNSCSFIGLLCVTVFCLFKIYEFIAFLFIQCDIFKIYSFPLIYLFVLCISPFYVFLWYFPIPDSLPCQTPAAFVACPDPLGGHFPGPTTCRLRGASTTRCPEKSTRVMWRVWLYLGMHISYRYKIHNNTIHRSENI